MVDLAPVPLGADYYSAEAMSARLLRRIGPVMMDAAREGLAAMAGGWMLADTPGGREELRELADPRLRDIVDELRPADRVFAGWVGDPPEVLHGSVGGPQSREPGGVGDVAGERGDRARTWEAVKRGDNELAYAAMAPDGEVGLTTGGRMDAEIYLGPNGLRSAYETWASSWDSMVMEATEFIDVSEDQLIVHFTARGHSTQTGLDLELARDWVYTMRNATVLRIQEFQTREEALKALGLEV
jgi:ketosteroid isomerase-like protein